MQVRSVGHYRVRRGWRDLVLAKPFFELFWCIAGTMEFRHGEETWQLGPEEVFCYLPGDRHQTAALSAVLEYCWFTLDGPEAWSVVRGFGIGRGNVPAGRCPEELFLRLMNEVRGIGRDSEYRAGAVAYEILTRAMIGPRGGSRELVRRFRKVVEEEYCDPGFSVDAAAAKLGVHRSTLTRQVTEECGISPREYLTGYRIQLAIEIMKQEKRASIKEVAEATGFADQNYFAKVFRKHLGKNPAGFRKLL